MNNQESSEYTPQKSFTVENLSTYDQSMNQQMIISEGGIKLGNQDITLFHIGSSGSFNLPKHIANQDLQCPVSLMSPYFAKFKICIRGKKIKKNKMKRMIKSGNTLDQFYEGLYHFNMKQKFEFDVGTFRQFWVRRRTININSWQQYPVHEGPTDLGVCSLAQLIQLCCMKDILPKALFKKVELQDVNRLSEIYLQKIMNEEYQNIKYDKCMMSPFQHRMLSFILVSRYPESFVYPQKPLCFNKNATIFYTYLYSISDQTYWNLYNYLNLIALRQWLPSSAIVMQKIESKCAIWSYSQMAQNCSKLQTRSLRNKKKYDI